MWKHCFTRYSSGQVTAKFWVSCGDQTEISTINQKNTRWWFVCLETHPSQAAQTLHRREQQKTTEDNKEDFDPLTLKLWSAIIIIMQQLVHQEGHLSLNLSWINQSAHLDQNRFNLTLHQQAWWKKVQRYRLINFTKFSSTISSPHECEEGEIYYLISYV